MTQYNYFFLLGLIQLVHSQEEIWTGFHKKWFVFKMPFWVFVFFESVLSISIIVYMINPHLIFASFYMPAFAFVMFINGVGHIVWSLVVKKYVPGLITAPLFVIVFGFYYASLIRIGG